MLFHAPTIFTGSERLLSHEIWLSMSSLSPNSSPATQITKLVKNTEITFTPNAQKILEKRYLRKKDDGAPAETVEQMFDRIATTVAEPDRPYRDVEVSKIEFYNLLSLKKFFPCCWKDKSV